MKHILGNDFKMSNTCVAFGSFDGVHRGHQAVIDKLIQISKQGFTSLVLSYEYDETFLNERQILSTEDEKEYILSKNGLDIMISYKINDENKDINIEDFIEDILVNKLGVKVIVAGKDDPNIFMLHKLSSKFGYKVEECETIKYNEKPLTSLDIIKELEEGTLEKVNEMLGHPYLIMGQVMHGKALGRTVGMPTANLGFSKHKKLPVFGVYGTLSKIDDRYVKGLTNIGQRPSVDNYNYVTIETFLLDFSEDIYDKIILLEICVYIRGVIKFDSLAQVKAQVNKDIEGVRTHLDESSLEHCVS